MIIRNGVTDDNPIIGTHNLVTVNNIASTSTDPNYSEKNLANPATHLKWKMNAVSSALQWITVTISPAQTINYVAVAAQNFVSEGISCAIEATAGAGSVNRVPTTLITDTHPIIFQFADVANCTEVRLLMSGTNFLAQFGVLYVGHVLTFEKSLRIDANHTPMRFGFVSTVNSGMSESGQFLGRVSTNRYKESKMDFSYLTDSFYRNNLDLFQWESIERPFFVAWAPQSAPFDSGFCWFTKDPKPELHLPTQRWLYSFEMRGIA